MKHRNMSIWMAVAAGLCGCGEATVDSAAPTSESVRVEYRELWDVGTIVDEDPLLVTSMATLDIARAGNLFISDPTAGSVVVVDPMDGSLVRRIGRPGEGPGELATPGALEVREDGQLWVVNSHSYRFTVFDTAGAFIRRVPRADRATPSQGAQLHWADNFFWDIGYEGGEMVIRRVDSLGVVLESGPPLPPSDRPDFSGFLVGPITNEFREITRRYADIPTFTFLPDGTLWYGSVQSYSLRRFAPDGRVLDSISVPEGEMELSEAEKQEIRSALIGQGASWDDVRPARRQIAKVVPHPRGWFLFQRYDEFGAVGRTVDVVNPGEGVIGRIELSYPIHWRSRPTMRGDTLFYVGFGDLDVPHVVKAVVGPPS